MKTTFLISLAAVLSTPLYAQCLPEEGRFEKATIDYHGTNYWVINDNRTNLQWMMCPMGQQGEQCVGDAILEKRGNLVELIETFNQAESNAALTWRLPHTQELITITDQSCRYGTYPEFFKLSQTTEALEQLYQAVAPYKEKFDILYQRHQDNLVALEKKRQSNPEVDEKVVEWLENSHKLLNGEWSQETSDYVYKELVPWLKANAPEWVAATTSRNKFSNAFHWGDKELGLERLSNHYSDNYYLLNQLFATQAGYSVSFKNVPNLGTTSDNRLHVSYMYTLYTLGSLSDWTQYYVRLVRPIPQDNR
ncbi:DUF1566 domain-containing protein [Vibrio vulnificus]|uniref:DUF1566 domain-containing protein n=1 Tax=Vibrio TaxID=662 RepID=UPI001029ACEC|nr:MULTISPECIES: DUF1566 domain-containing protein [Vibrio]EGQ9831826.1 DUF1566 domain-containing protein [Vibrio vulnificus]EGR7952876.1 DUF1566 domain-containing protein [Vibrio vulnificus]EHU5196468.1 DUF1566 domain-containing protein [Vibrio vulnificus]EHU9450087.1 DUF1566 domain-containing protein [Vibrio vulnificus]EHY1014138.1 DUF1566 domain-containing protein [Vibrio vulnificus]